MIEIWKPVKGYEERFVVSNFGNVISAKSGRPIKTHIQQNGYEAFATRIGGRDGICKLLRIHRLVADAFILNPDNKPFVNHIDGVKTNNNLNNLEWCTASENIKHAISSGLITRKRGVENSNAKFSQQEIDFIRANYIERDKVYGCRALARQFNVNHKTISEIVKGNRY
jgi:hypothetical protein